MYSVDPATGEQPSWLILKSLAAGKTSGGTFFHSKQVVIENLMRELIIKLFLMISGRFSRYFSMLHKSLFR
jgi:hypothetical protein